MAITTNHHSRPFLSREEVPTKILNDQFDWTSSENFFLRYKGVYYHISQFMRLPPVPGGWTGSCAESATTGVVIKVEGCESYKIGFWTADVTR